MISVFFAWHGEGFNCAFSGFLKAFFWSRDLLLGFPGEGASADEEDCSGVGAWHSWSSWCILLLFLLLPLLVLVVAGVARKRSGEVQLTGWLVGAGDDEDVG